MELSLNDISLTTGQTSSHVPGFRLATQGPMALLLRFIASYTGLCARVQFMFKIIQHYK